MKRRVKLILLAIILIGTALRWFNLYESTSFFYDQARDALKVQEILRGDLALIGPLTDTPGLFMGPLWYYLLTPLYFVLKGHPVLVTMAVSLLDIATIPLFYLVGRLFFGKKVALLSSAIWAFSAGPVAYARTLANPSTTVFWTLLFIFFLQKNRIIAASLFFAIIFQLNPPSAYLLLPFVAVIYWLKVRRAVSLKNQLLALFLLITSFLPIVAFEFRNDFPGLQNLPALVFGGGGGLRGIQMTISYHWQTWVHAIENYTLPGPYLALIINILGLVFLVRKKINHKSLFIIWALVPPLTYIILYLRYESHPHYLLSLIPPATFVIAYAVSFLARKLNPLIIIFPIIFCLLNFSNLTREIIQKDHLAQPGDPNKIGFADQVKVIDLIYVDSNRAAFGYYAYNLLPYWGDEAWQYLFAWYGKGKYGYLPERNGGDIIYIIYEPDPLLADRIQGPWLKRFYLDYCELENFTVNELKVKKMRRCLEDKVNMLELN